MHTLIPLSLPQEERLFHHGIALFNAGRYFDAHEAWEEIWCPLGPGLKKDFYQALIQAAAALYQFQRGNAVGLSRLLDRFRHRAAALPPVCMGVDLPALAAALTELAAPILALTPPPPRGSFTLVPATAPAITLRFDPFATGQAPAQGGQVHLPPKALPNRDDLPGRCT